jgi:hypothetical protein
MLYGETPVPPVKQKYLERKRLPRCSRRLTLSERPHRNLLRRVRISHRGHRERRDEATSAEMESN